MKNIFKLKAIQRIAGIIVLVAVIGFSFAACGNDDDGGGTGGGDDNSSQTSGGGEGGTFMLTGIPSQYNGKYACFMKTVSNSKNLLGAQSINMSEQTFTLCLISNGSASIPVWTHNEAKDGFVRYTGNDTSEKFPVIIYNSQTSLPSFGTSSVYLIGMIQFSNVIFSNGSVTKSWSEGTYQSSGHE